MRYRYNPFRRVVPAFPVSEALAFHRSMPGYQPTELRIDSDLNAYIKDESTRFGINAFKALGASWAMRCLMRSSEGIETFAAATDGNHGRAVAWMARRLGCRAVIFVPANAIPGRVRAVAAEGAEIRHVDGSYDDAVRACDAESTAQGWQVLSDTGYPGSLEIPRLVTEGYRTLFDEFELQRSEHGWPQPSTVIIQAGVGGLLCAAVQHFSQCGYSPMLVAVEPEDADCLLESISSPDGEPRSARGSQNSVMACLNCGEVSLSAWPTVRAGVDLFLAIEDSYATTAMTQMPNAGDSGAAGLAGLLAMRDHGLNPRGPVLLINTEGTLPSQFA